MADPDLTAPDSSSPLANDPRLESLAEEKHAQPAPDHKLLAAIVQSSDDAIISRSLDNVITSWNPAAERLFGYEASEVLGKSLSELIPADCWANEDRRTEQLT